MSRSLAIARKDFRDIFRERTILLALLLQLFIAAFSSFLMVGLVGLYDPGEAETSLRSRIAYVGPGEFAQRLDNESALRIVVLDQPGAKAAFDAGLVAAIVEELYIEPDGIRTINLLLPDGELTTTLLVTLLKDHLKAYERELRVERAEDIETRIVFVDAPGGTSPYFAFSYALLVPLLLVVPAFISGAIAADSVTQEIETRTLELLRASPAGARSIYLGKLVAPIVLAPLQALLWILLLDLNGIQIHHPVLLLLMIAALTTLLVSVSVFFGLALRKQGDAQIAYSLFILLLFGASYLLPQPLLATLARLAVGSLEFVELGSLSLVVGAALALVGIGSALAPRLFNRLP